MFEGACLILLLGLGIVYAIICFFDSITDNEYDDVTEQRCKRCVHYKVCSNHGCKYNCKDFYEEDDL